MKFDLKSIEKPKIGLAQRLIQLIGIMLALAIAFMFAKGAQSQYRSWVNYAPDQMVAEVDVEAVVLDVAEDESIRSIISNWFNETSVVENVNDKVAEAQAELHKIKGWGDRATFWVTLVALFIPLFKVQRRLINSLLGITPRQIERKKWKAVEDAINRLQK